MNSMRVYIDARAAEAAAPDMWYDADKLLELDQRVREDLGQVYRFLDRLAARVGELAGPTALPKKDRHRTDFQRGYAAGVAATGGTEDEAA